MASNTKPVVRVSFMTKPVCSVFRDGRWLAISSKAAVTLRLDAAQATAPRDWHNDYAALLLDLRNALLQEADDRRRQELLGEVRRLIDAHRATEATGAKGGAKRSA